MLYQKIKRFVILLAYRYRWRNSDICPIMTAYYKARPEVRNPQNRKCDIPQSRALYQKLRGTCHQGKCLPCKETPRIVNRERHGPPRKRRLTPLYGKGYSEHTDDCIVCQAGLRARCYIEYGENPQVRQMLSQDYVGSESYHNLVCRLKARAP